MKFAINVGKKIIQTLKNARMKRNVSIAKETMPLMIKHVRNGKRKKKFKESRQKEEFHTQMPRNKWTYLILLLGSKGGWRTLAMNKYYNIMATQNRQTTDRKRIRTSPDFMTSNLDSVQICTWPRFLLVKGTDNERPLSKLSPFAVNKAIVAVLGSDPFNMKKLRNGDILVELDKENQSSKLLKTTKLNCTMLSPSLYHHTTT